MVRAMKSVSVERVRDPADFTLMCFGGAGPIHAAGVARELGIRQLLMPPSPGVFSAFGLLRAQVDPHAARTVLTRAPEDDIEKLAAAYDATRADFMARVGAEGYSAASVKWKTFVDIR